MIFKDFLIFPGFFTEKKKGSTKGHLDLTKVIKDQLYKMGFPIYEDCCLPSPSQSNLVLTASPTSIQMKSIEDTIKDGQTAIKATQKFFISETPGQSEDFLHIEVPDAFNSREVIFNFDKTIPSQYIVIRVDGLSGLAPNFIPPVIMTSDDNNVEVALVTILERTETSYKISIFNNIIDFNDKVTLRILL